MGKLAFVFPGQGSQKAGMGKELADNYDLSRQAFENTDKRLEEKLSDLIFEGPQEDLTLTANAQPALLTTSMAAFYLLKEEGITPEYVAGHSLGEYSAVVAAGGLSQEDAAWSVRRRGQLMQEAVPVGVGTMAAIIGMSTDDLEDLCTTVAGNNVLSLANINSDSQVVLAGHTEAVEAAIIEAKNRGAKRALPLPVSAPFHCSLMKPAQDGMVDVLNQVTFSPLSVPLVNNADVAELTDAEAVKQGLIKQVVSPVRWLETMHKMLELGVDTVVEVGPGRVLSGLFKRASRDLKLYNVEDMASLNTTIEALRG